MGNDKLWRTYPPAPFRHGRGSTLVLEGCCFASKVVIPLSVPEFFLNGVKELVRGEVIRAPIPRPPPATEGGVRKYLKGAGLRAMC